MRLLPKKRISSHHSWMVGSRLLLHLPSYFTSLHLSHSPHHTTPPHHSPFTTQHFPHHSPFTTPHPGSLPPHMAPHRFCSSQPLQTFPHTCSLRDVKTSHAPAVATAAPKSWVASPDMSPHLLPQIPDITSQILDPTPLPKQKKNNQLRKTF